MLNVLLLRHSNNEHPYTFSLCIFVNVSLRFISRNRMARSQVMHMVLLGISKMYPSGCNEDITWVCQSLQSLRNIVVLCFSLIWGGKWYLVLIYSSLIGKIKWFCLNSQFVVNVNPFRNWNNSKFLLLLIRIKINFDMLWYRDINIFLHFSVAY